jgi:hypothetical protein
MQEVFFLSPFVVGDGEVARSCSLDRSSEPVEMFSDTETGTARHGDVVPVDPEPAPMHDLSRGAA